MVGIEGMEMPCRCEVCDFRKTDPYSGEVYCNKAAGNNIILHEDEKLDNCPLVEIGTCKGGNKMNSEQARGYVHLAGYECQGTTRKALDIVLSDSEKLEQIREIVNDWNNDDIEGQDTVGAFHLILGVLGRE